MKKYVITDELYSKLMNLIKLDTGKKKDLHKRIGIPKHKCQSILYRQVRYISSDLLAKFEEYFHVDLHRYISEDIEDTKDTKNAAITQNEIDKLQMKIQKLYIRNYEALVKNLQLITESQSEINRLKSKINVLKDENKELKRLLAEKQ